MARPGNRDVLDAGEWRRAKKLLRTLDRYLEDEGAPPDIWLAGIIAEQMHVPLVAGGAVDQPYAMTMDVLHLRAYAQTKAAVERAQKGEDVPESYYKDLVWELTAERLQRRKERR